MTMNDLTAPLGQGPRPYRRAIEVSAAQIIAVALGLFFGAFVLWAVTAEDRAGGEPVAVAPADLRMAQKAPEGVAGGGRAAGPPHRKKGAGGERGAASRRPSRVQGTRDNDSRAALGSGKI